MMSEMLPAILRQLKHVGGLHGLWVSPTLKQIDEWNRKINRQKGFVTHREEPKIPSRDKDR